jgi:hypothetical protein
MDHTGRNRKRLSRLQTKGAAIDDIYFQFAFYDKETLIGMWMLVPPEFPLHHRHTDAVVVNVQNDEILVGLLDRGGLLSEIHYR